MGADEDGHQNDVNELLHDAVLGYEAKLVDLLYSAVLGRKAEPEALEARVAALRGGVSFADMFQEVATSEEARNRTSSGNLAGADIGGVGPLVVLNDHERIPLIHEAIILAYAHFLRRRPSAQDSMFWTEVITKGMPVENFLNEISRSEEAVLKDIQFGTAADQSDDELVKLLYKAVLGREVEPEALKVRVDTLTSGVSFANMFWEVATGEEARNRPPSGNAASADVDRAKLPIASDDERVALIYEAITLAYTHFLRRRPSIDELKLWAETIHTGMPVEKFLSEIGRSEEASLRARQFEIGAGLSDGEFLMAAGEPLFGRGLMPVETVAWQRRLESGGLTRSEMIHSVVVERINTALHPAAEAIVNDADACSILGTSRMISRKQWNKRAHELHRERRPQSRQIDALEQRQFCHSGEYVVSMIASLYKGRAFIEKFLDNIVSQTLFHRSELIIIDAESPEGEEEVIRSYQSIYPNIVYKRINYRLGIYDAWNVGVSMSRGRYITNTNLDDLRREDSIALQAEFLDSKSDIDVVYQDFYYSFDPSLDFEEVAAFDFKSELPIITPNNLLLFNSPHNAPMWRKSLHEQIGLFDTRYRSAGDYEFWVRCLVDGKTFGKINDPHVVYYQNPTGISTRPDTRGIEEARDVLRRYSPKLTRSALLQSRRDLHAGLGIKGGSQDIGEGKSYYDVIQDALMELRGRKMTDYATSSHQHEEEQTSANVEIHR